MIMVVGQVETSVKEREAFHELDYHGAFGNMIKWTVEVDHPDRITEVETVEDLSGAVEALLKDKG